MAKTLRFVIVDLENIVIETKKFIEKKKDGYLDNFFLPFYYYIPVIIELIVVKATKNAICCVRPIVVFSERNQKGWEYLLPNSVTPVIAREYAAPFRPGSQAADMKIKQYLKKWEINLPKSYEITLVSGDGGYLEILDRLRRKGHTIRLIALGCELNHCYRSEEWRPWVTELKEDWIYELKNKTFRRAIGSVNSFEMNSCHR